MATKARIPAPIDRPLSRAYLRQFLGWSTAYPPGASEPASLRLMENVMINRDGSVRIRPGLRYINYRTPPNTVGPVFGTSDYPQLSVIGAHEPFFLNDGSKAYLYAVREPSGGIGFRVLAFIGSTQVIKTLAEADFFMPQGEASLKFTWKTTYVKYLQIDNNIFALSNAGEELRLFAVGTNKVAKRMNSINRPQWSVQDKLTVVHPDAAWIGSSLMMTARMNLATNPSFETTANDWVLPTPSTYDQPSAKITRVPDAAQEGAWSLKVESLPSRTNLVPSPLHNPDSTGVAGWVNASPLTQPPLIALGDALFFGVAPGRTGNSVEATTLLDVKPGLIYWYAFDLVGSENMTGIEPWFTFYDANGVQLTSGQFLKSGAMDTNPEPHRCYGQFSTPANAYKMKLAITLYGTASIAVAQVKNVLVCGYKESIEMFHGGSGADYFWSGAPNDSASIGHPPTNVILYHSAVGEPELPYLAAAYVRATGMPAYVTFQIDFRTAVDAQISSTAPMSANDVAGVWTRFSSAGTSPPNTGRVRLSLILQNVGRGNPHYIDAVQIEQSGAALGTFFSGDTADDAGKEYEWTGNPHASSSTEKMGAFVIPAAETPTGATLVSSAPAANIWSFGFFYTFSNEVGESAVSQVSVIRTQRSWNGWRWETPNASGEPSGVSNPNPELCVDQLVAYMPPAVFASAMASGAIKWSLYAFTWSDQDPMPVTALKVGERALTPLSTYGATAWLRATPSQAEVTAETAPIPNLSTRLNASKPSCAGQGIVAADRMVLVFDPVSQAVIKWSSNQQGSYTDFSPSKGGGYKTLTSGNLYVPATVKLWQNPQSADTLTILMLGSDGTSTGYYMAPAQISSQSESLNIMGFEETTATPGTTSPYGCEVMNNALYHPLDDVLMKSVASNYNINHTSVTDNIRNMWSKLTTKNHIVVSQHDNRLYYLVNNPDGKSLEIGCWGNEVWVFDAAQKAGSWSRWLVQGQSLRKIEQKGRVVMSLVHPSGIFYFDEQLGTDDYVDVVDNKVKQRSIPWLLETNTQGANRAHDAWAHLQQANLTLGFFTGKMRYGVRGYDLNGKPVHVEKVFRAHDSPSSYDDSSSSSSYSSDGGDNSTSKKSFDVDDFLLIRRDMKEWFFFASSYTSDSVVQPSFGQITLVQYRYTPVSVNVGYEFGSVETFEYSRSGDSDSTTDNGVPKTYIDTRRP